ncbi:hypothetical protein M407DRAFT_206309 [Tulasnella calospora MUT 4182]|uniref:Uncharacterized protein n=1 Tax=Tulasnella calospora MUT 4182 TaxID=1051891 RepID=A0A0C3LX09_9AGAM|nr:hypothetical protein M407DRAFT_206309 [Tulasnella calospora MUT 4182]
MFSRPLNSILQLQPTPLPTLKDCLQRCRCCPPLCLSGNSHSDGSTANSAFSNAKQLPARLGKLPRPSRKGTGRSDDPLLEPMQVYGVLSSRTEIRGMSTSKVQSEIVATSTSAISSFISPVPLLHLMISQPRTSAPSGGRTCPHHQLLCQLDSPNHRYRLS